MGRKIHKYLIGAGVLLIAAALALTAYNAVDAQRAAGKRGAGAGSTGAGVAAAR